MTAPLRRWLLGHRVSRRRLLELLEGERRARLALPATMLDLHARIARLEAERDDACAEAKGAKGALEAARRERDHEAHIASTAVSEVQQVAARAEAEVARARRATAVAEAWIEDVKRSGYAGPGYAVVRLAPDDGRYTTTPDDPSMTGRERP